MMLPDGLHTLLQQVTVFHHAYMAVIDIGFLVFTRLIGFFLVAPIFGRKDLPFALKISIAMALTATLITIMPITPAQRALVNSEDIFNYTVQIIVNVTIGYLIGFIAAVILEALSAAGALMNNQIGLSSSIFFDPATRQQVAVMEKIFSFIGTVVFLELGGMYWLLNALNRSFEIFPVNVLKPDIAGAISLDYLVQITSNALEIGLILVAPIFVVTIAIDLILGIVNRTAQQIQVFQLSFSLKPVIGITVFLLTLPIFMQVLQHYLNDYAKIF